MTTHAQTPVCMPVTFKHGQYICSKGAETEQDSRTAMESGKGSSGGALAAHPLASGELKDTVLDAKPAEDTGLMAHAVSVGEDAFDEQGRSSLQYWHPLLLDFLLLLLTLCQRMRDCKASGLVVQRVCRLGHFDALLQAKTERRSARHHCRPRTCPPPPMTHQRRPSPLRPTKQGSVEL